MKKLNVVFIVVIILFTISCKKDFLDRKATDSIPNKNVFSDPDLMKLFLNNMYLDVQGFEFNLYSNISDESRTYWAGGPKDVIVGDWGPNSNPMDYWAYTAIRKCNSFLTNLDGSAASEDEKKVFKGQVKFLRALQYFKMIKRYGGVPIITVPQKLTDDLFVKRQTTDSCFRFVINELQDAIKLLPDTYGSRDIDVGKANKWSAEAYLGRVLLFWASPLYNPDGDRGRWEQAAAVNKDVIDNGPYELYPDFRRIMLDKNNQEEIFSVQYLKPYRQHGWDSWNMMDSRSRQSASAICPLQDLVGAFEMKNGKSIDDPTSGYDPTHPYLNRDPRLQASVVVNGSTYGFQGLPVYTYIGGLDGINNPYETVTGYYLRKGTDETNQDYYGNIGSDQNWIELRFAEVLLNYAEAKNQTLSSPDQSVYDAVERIRKRAGLDPYQLPTGLSKAQMRDRIRHERYVELAFERKRYWDLKRWKTAVGILNGKEFHGMFITKHGDGHYTYEIKPVDAKPCVFTDKMYFMPIPQSEMDKNPNLIQNEGW
jgi:hypothetical protein